MRCALIIALAFALAACSGARPALAPDSGSPPPPACTGPDDASWPGWREGHPQFLLVHVTDSLNGGVLLATDRDPFLDFDGGPCGAIEFSPVFESQPHTVPSAGVLTISSPHATTTIVPDDGGDYPGSYDFGRHPPPGHLPGEPISVAGTGAEIPAFSLSVNSPLVPTILSPAFPPDGGPLFFDADAGLEITWANAACGDQLVIELGTSGIDTSETVRCAVPASHGHFTIPPELAKGMSGLTIESYRAAVVDAGAWPVIEQVSTFAVQPDGRRFSGPLRAQ